jgi:hypothetical protein
MPVNPNDISKAVFAISKVLLTKIVNISVSPKKISLIRATV